MLDFLMDANIKLSVREQDSASYITLICILFFLQQRAQIIVDAYMFPNLREFCQPFYLNS